MDEQIQASAELMAALQKSKLLDDIYANPKLKGRLLEVVKEQRPELSIPEHDARAAVLPELEQMRRENQELRADMARERLKRDHDLDDADLVSLGKTMKEEGIARVDTAIELQRYRAASSPRNTPNSGLQLPDSKELFNDPRGWAQREAHKVISEFRRGGR